MATRAKSVALLLFFFLSTTLGSSFSSSSEPRGGRLIRSEPVLARVLADGQVAEQREEGPQQQLRTAEPTTPDDEEATVVSQSVAGASAAAVQLHSAKEAVKDAQVPDYLVLAKQWAVAASAINEKTTAVARQVFGDAVDVSAEGRFHTVATALPRFLTPPLPSVDIEKEFWYNIPRVGLASGTGFNEPRLAFTFPQPADDYAWLMHDKGVQPIRISLCPRFFNKSVETQAAIVLHEVLHHLGCNDLPHKSLYDTNTWVRYVLEVTFNSTVTLYAGTPRPLMDCERLPGQRCFKELNDGNCLVIAKTQGMTCKQYCSNSGMFCDNSWSPTNLDQMCATRAGKKVRKLTNATFCEAMLDQQLCSCTGDDLLGTMDIIFQGTTTTTRSSSTTTSRTSTTKRRR